MSTQVLQGAELTAADLCGVLRRDGRRQLGAYLAQTGLRLGERERLLNAMTRSPHHSVATICRARRA